VACRYCFRKNELALTDEIFDPDFLKTLEYLRSNKEVNEIIFSGGDPFILSDEKINYYLEEFSKISSIKFIRFHTRTPIIIPSRINDSLITVLLKHAKHFSRLMIMIHVNHIEELDNEVQESLLKLQTHPIEVFSQTVLLKNINDKTETLKDLFLKLSDLRIIPYYLHHPDLVLGGMHFYLSLEEGRKIFAPLHNMLPGWALPQYVIDIPGGEGKTTAINPENFSFSGQLINRLGLTVTL
jgi:lysine 2,3-aminomutase